MSCPNILRQLIFYSIKESRSACFSIELFRIFAYTWVICMRVCPIIFDTDSIGTS